MTSKADKRDKLYTRMRTAEAELRIYAAHFLAGDEVPYEHQIPKRTLLTRLGALADNAARARAELEAEEE